MAAGTRHGIGAPCVAASGAGAPLGPKRWPADAQPLWCCTLECARAAPHRFSLLMGFVVGVCTCVSPACWGLQLDGPRPDRAGAGTPCTCARAPPPLHARLCLLLAPMCRLKVGGVTVGVSGLSSQHPRHPLSALHRWSATCASPGWVSVVQPLDGLVAAPGGTSPAGTARWSGVCTCAASACMLWGWSWRARAAGSAPEDGTACAGACGLGGQGQGQSPSLA